MSYKLLCLALFCAITFSALAQNDGIEQRMSKDLFKRFPETEKVTISWKQKSYGYMAFYTLSNESRMSLYNGSGKFLKSFKQESWETRVPQNVKMNFDNSPYYSFSVIYFWESDPYNYKTYFLEMQDKEGVAKEAWFDENGKFSSTPL